MAYLFGIGGVLLFWLFSSVMAGNMAPFALARTESMVEGRRQRELSASKLQMVIWTYVTLFAYGSVFGALFLNRGAGEVIPALPQIPLNLLILMGLSVTTAAGAKGVTVSYKAQGRIPERSGGVATDPHGNPDLVKVQMLTWTAVAAVYYLLRVISLISGYESGILTLPDVDGALLVLMGASQGAYLGDKLVSRDLTKKPKLTAVKPAQGPAGTVVTLLGENLGETQGQNFVEIDDVPVRDGLVWSNLQIQNVTIPADASGDVRIKVYRDGEYSETLSFRVS